MSAAAIPLFVCHANCCRSVLASYLYRHLCPDATVLSAGFDPGERTSDTALAMLAHWGVDATGHHPTKLNRRRCEQASAIFVMAPPYVSRLLHEYGHDLGTKAYLYREPFCRPESFGPEHTVPDPSFDPRPTGQLVKQFSWSASERFRSTSRCSDTVNHWSRPRATSISYKRLILMATDDSFSTPSLKLHPEVPGESATVGADNDVLQDCRRAVRLVADSVATPRTLTSPCEAHTSATSCPVC